MLQGLNSQLPREMVLLAGECSFLAPWTVLMCFMSYDFKGGCNRIEIAKGLQNMEMV